MRHNCWSPEDQQFLASHRISQHSLGTECLVAASLGSSMMCPKELSLGRAHYLPPGRERSHAPFHVTTAVRACLCIGFICYRNRFGKNFPTIISIPQESDTVPKILNILRVALTCSVLCQEHFFLKGILTRMPFCTKVIDIQVMSDVLTTIYMIDSSLRPPTRVGSGPMILSITYE